MNLSAAELLWENKEKIAIVFLLALSFGLMREVKLLRVELAAKPKIEEKIVTKVTQGPVRIVEKIIEKPGGEKIVERVITRDVVVKEAASERVEAPACPQASPAPRWLIGASADPFRSQDGPILKGGLTINNRLDLIGGHSVIGPNRAELGVMVRF